MDEALRELVQKRAVGRCEYCLLPQLAARFFTFHVEHIRAKQHGGQDDESNLALACPDCNAHKGPNLTSIDPLTDTIVPIFNPRTENWRNHFVRQGAIILGVSAIGRATAELLNMNDSERVEMREALLANGEW